MTRRERLEAKIEKRREWAISRGAKADALLARNAPYRGDYAFNTQPGHIPERARVIQREDRAFEHQKMAEHHESKAEGLAAQVDRSIYSDDDDAISELEARIAERTAERDRLKAYNASCRKAAKKGGRGDLSLLSEAQQRDLAGILRVCPYQVREGGAFPAYVAGNLSGRIAADRERLETIQRQQARRARAEEAGGVLVEGGEYVCVTFTEKPAREVLEALKSAGFQYGGGSWGGRREALPVEVARAAEAHAEPDPADRPLYDGYNQDTPEYDPQDRSGCDGEPVDPAVYACPDGERCQDPECVAENERRCAAAPCSNCSMPGTVQVVAGHFADTWLCYRCWLNRRAIVRAIHALSGGTPCRHCKPLALALLALLLAFPALAAPAHRIKPLETVTVRTMPPGSLKRAEYHRVTALDADSCTVWIEEPVNGETAFRACRSAILRCQGGDCRKGGVK